MQDLRSLDIGARSEDYPAATLVDSVPVTKSPCSEPETHSQIAPVLFPKELEE